MLLDGYKTYIVGAVAIILGIAGAVFPEAGLTADPMSMIATGLVALGLRRGMKTG